ncbi:hypothetical protein SPRG_20861, partial [Saprolegnia parasitica CBS 223.65]
PPEVRLSGRGVCSPVRPPPLRAPSGQLATPAAEELNLTTALDINHVAAVFHATARRKPAPKSQKRSYEALAASRYTLRGSREGHTSAKRRQVEITEHARMVCLMIQAAL